MSQLRQHVFGTPRHDEIKKQKCESSSQFRQHKFGTPQHDKINKP